MWLWGLNRYFHGMSSAGCWPTGTSGWARTGMRRNGNGGRRASASQRMYTQRRVEGRGRLERLQPAVGLRRHGAPMPGSQPLQGRHIDDGQPPGGSATQSAVEGQAHRCLCRPEDASAGLSPSHRAVTHILNSEDSFWLSPSYFVPL